MVIGQEVIEEDQHEDVVTENLYLLKIPSEHNATTLAKSVRDNFIEYLVNEGAVQSQ